MTGRVLIADDVATNRIILKVKLSAARYQVLQARDVAGLLESARLDRPDLVIADLNLPGGGACAALEGLQADPDTATIPLIAVTDDPSRTARIAGLAAGAVDVLVKPLDEEALMALVRNRIRVHGTHEDLRRKKTIAREFGLAESAPGYAPRAHVMLVPQGAEAGFAWRSALTGKLSDVISVGGRNEALDSFGREGPPDAFVVSATIARERDGLHLVSELRSREATRHAIIMVHNSSGDPLLTTMALDMGASAVLCGSFDAEEVALRLRHLLAQKRETDALRAALDQQLSLAITDPLTGLYNRRYASSYLSRLMPREGEKGQPFTLMVLDLDRFKQVNDRFGHAVGDQVLIEVARRLRANMREMDLLARLGGEEFLVVLPETGRAEAEHAAERLRRVIGDTPVQIAAQDLAVPVTMSIGVVLGGNAPEPIENLIECADRALYASKSEGRNQVTFVRRAA